MMENIVLDTRFYFYLLASGGAVILSNLILNLRKVKIDKTFLGLFWALSLIFLSIVATRSYGVYVCHDIRSIIDIYFIIYIFLFIFCSFYINSNNNKALIVATLLFIAGFIQLLYFSKDPIAFILMFTILIWNGVFIWWLYKNRNQTETNMTCIPVDWKPNPNTKPTKPLTITFCNAIANAKPIVSPAPVIPVIPSVPIIPVIPSVPKHHVIDSDILSSSQIFQSVSDPITAKGKSSQMSISETVDSDFDE
jgi:hypothetical protein